MPTTTAAVLITDALKEIQVIGEDSEPSALMLSDGLRMLNRMLGTLSISSVFGYDSELRSIALTGQASFDIGPSGDIVSLRPIKLSSAYYTLDGIDYDEIDIIDMSIYDAIPLKTTTGAVPDVLAYNGTYPDGTVYVYPLCSGGTLNFRAVELVKAFTSAETQIEMPEGYEDYIMLKLAIRMAPSYNRTPSPGTLLAAKTAARAVKRNNKTPCTMRLPAALARRGSGNLAAIYRG